MHFTILNLMGTGMVQTDAEYENDWTKKQAKSKKELDRNELNDPYDVMYNLNNANWGHHIESHDGVYKKMIGDLDCLRISYRQKKLSEGRKIKQSIDYKYNHLVYLPL